MGKAFLQAEMVNSSRRMIKIIIASRNEKTGKGTDWNGRQDRQMKKLLIYDI